MAILGGWVFLMSEVPLYPEHSRRNGPPPNHHLAYLSAVLSAEGRVVELCWAKSKPKGPKGQDALECLVQEIVTVVNLIIQNRNLEYGERRCGFEAPKHQRSRDW